MTRRQSHLGKFRRIPRGNNHAAIIWIGFKFFYHSLQLIHALAGIITVVIFVFRVKMPPLKSVNRPKVSFIFHFGFSRFIVAIWSFFWVGPFIPNMIVVILEPGFV